MKVFTLVIVSVSALLLGCNQSSSPIQADPKTVANFEKSDDRLTILLDKLDSDSISKDERQRIICKDYPEEYTNNYMPNLLKIAPKDYSQERLMLDLESALAYYKDKDQIEC